nr:unnamed protein product [Digitaria exilis]
MSGLYSQGFSPARTLSPQIRSNPDADSQYLAELLAEHQKLGPFMQVLPICSRLLNQVSKSSLAENSYQTNDQRLGFPPPGTSMDWQGAPPSPGSYIVKKIIRLEVPVDSYPNVLPPTTCAVYPSAVNDVSVLICSSLSFSPVQFCGAHSWSKG